MNQTANVPPTADSKPSLSMGTLCIPPGRERRGTGSFLHDGMSVYVHGDDPKDEKRVLISIEKEAKPVSFDKSLIRI
jgi:hypothetical protein